MDYPAVRLNAQNAIVDTGMAMKIVSKIGQVTDQVNGTVSAGIPKLTNCTGVQYPTTVKTKDGVLQKTRAVLIGAEGLKVAPVVGMQLRIGSTDFEIIDVEPLEPGGVMVIYTVTVKVP